MIADTGDSLLKEASDFSLVLGGPLYQMMRRAHLSGHVLELVAHGMIVLALFAWLPLLALSIAEGRGCGDSVKVPFLLEVGVHARFLLSGCASWSGSL